ncbi:MAG TPA: Hint domain-containing protein [Vicinamibacterales bacterium]|nr:Hint domain-containing protein [Vicinamibacterales bacterium]
MSTTLIDRLGREVPAWTPHEWEQFQHVVRQTRPGVPLTHDLSNDLEFEFVVRQHGGRQFLERHYPGMLNVLERGRAAAREHHNGKRDPRLQHTLQSAETAAANQWYSTNAIVQSAVSTSGGNACVADGMSTVIDGTYLTMMTMSIADTTAGTLVAQESIPSQYNRGMYATLGAAGNLANAGDAGVAMLTVTAIPEGQQQAVVQTVSANVAQICPVAPPVVTAPIHIRTQTPNPIKIALNRTQAQQPDCDYYYTTTQQGGRNPDVEVQVMGKAIFQAQVCPLTFGSTLQGQLLLARRVNPGGAALLLPPDQFVAGLTPVGQQLGWSWGANNQFGAAPWDQGQLVDIILNLQLPVALNTTCAAITAPNAQANVVSSQSAQPSACTTKIDPLLFVWGCLAADTLVDMADGSRKRAIDVRLGDHVIGDAGGRTAIVMDRVLGWEDREDCVRISAGELSVIVTQDHPMIGPRGIVRAADVRPGTELRTRGGVVRVSAVERFRYRDRVVNLELRPLRPATGDDQLPLHGATHFANDFLVGDAVMQGALREWRSRQDEDDAAVLRGIPSELQMDFVNLQRARRGETLFTS